MKLKDLGEFNFINNIQKGIKLSDKVVKGIGDDAAVLKHAKDKYILFTTDMLVEGRHFRRKDRAEFVGWKALCCSISDIAAMGGEPGSAVVSMGAPGSLDLKYAQRLYNGIKKAADRFKIDLVGGDTVYSRDIIINIALTGQVEKKNLVLRSSAKENDAIFVTGEIGGSIKSKHLDFVPRVKEARFLVKNFKINSMIDISDGLLADLRHILEESSKGALVIEKAVPVSRRASGFDSAVMDGEDFELIFTLPERYSAGLYRKWPFVTRLSRIGTVLKSQEGFSIIRKNCKIEKINKSKPLGFTHF